tara:strand:- start:9456 stop:10256 length:801 start_codon:yes stop_codon:yes gene_type:complete
MFIARTSHSKGDTLKQCPLKFYLRYYEYIPEEEVNKDALNFGSFIHKILEDGYQENSLKNLEKLAEQHRATYKVGKKEKTRTNKCLKNFLRFNEKLGETVGVEYQFKIDLEEGMAYIGIIDRIIKGKDGGYLVIDYKTSKREKSKFDLFNDPQLQGYAFAISEIFDVPVKKITCAHYYPVTGNLVTVGYNSSQITNFKKSKINEFWRVRKMKKEEFAPQANEFCNWCGYQKYCPKKTNPGVARCNLQEAKQLIKESRTSAKRKAPR